MIHRWESFCYRKIMPGIRTHEEYENLRALDIQWDFAMAKLQNRLEEHEMNKQRNNR